MIRAITRWTALAVLGGVPVILAAQPVEHGMLDRKQTTEQQVRAMARELVAGVLDLQIRQLKENRLESHPIYADVVQMRRHLDLLVENEMAEVIDLLSRLPLEPGETQQQAWREARQKSRQILVALLVERQNLLRRLQIAEMAAQVEELIRMQSTLLATTRHLPEQPQTRREPLAISSIEDQRDVAAIYQRFKQTLGEVARWPAPVGSEAAEGLRLLETNHVDRELEQAEAQLRVARFLESAANQESVIEGLKKLLIQVQKLQGIAAPERSAADDVIQQLIEQQQAVRQVTEAADLSQPDTDKLINRQAEIHKQIAEMQQKSDLSPAARGALQQAEMAAKDAASRLFDQRREDALAQQDKVIEHLKKAADAAAPTESPPPQQSAEQLAAKTADLENARRELEQALHEQHKASAAATDQPAEAKHHEQKVAHQLGEVPKNRQLPEKVASRVAQAEQAARAAVAKLNQPAPAREEATRKAEQAIEEAMSAAETALADARRDHLAARERELDEAAKAMEKAASDERQVAHQAQQAAQSRGLEKPAAEQLSQRHAEARKTAAEAGKKVEKSVPQASQAVQAAQQPMAQAEAQLKSAQEKPAEASKPAAAAAAQHAQQAAEHLERASAQIRQEQQQAAVEKARLAEQQLQAVQQARRAVEQKLADRLETAGQRAQHLAQRPAEEFHHEAQSAAQLAGRAMPADSEATTALHTAENLGHAAVRQPQSAAQNAAADQSMQQAFELAAASLAARESQIANSLPAAVPAENSPSAPASAQRDSKVAAARVTGGGIDREMPSTNPTARAATPEQAPRMVAGGHKTSTGFSENAATAPAQDAQWFAQLPPNVRSAIRANAQRRPPRGYEERLQHYFQNNE